MEKEKPVRLVWAGKGTYQAECNRLEREVSRIYPRPVMAENGGLFPHPVTPSRAPSANYLINGDNLKVMQALLQEGYAGKIDLIYIDPPYLSQGTYQSRVEVQEEQGSKWLTRTIFKDAGYKDLDHYLEQIFQRLVLMKDLLSEQGSIIVHLDWHVSHYVRVLLDEVFSPKNLVNEIIWCYSGGSGSRRHFHRKHDNLYWYSKGRDYIFNPQYREYSSGTLQRGLTRVKGDKYKLHSQGALLQDWWTDINKILSPTAHENLKFPTQKPAALLERIVAAASEPDSLVADFYSGSGTLAEVCDSMQRRWLACDFQPLAIQTTQYRLVRGQAHPFEVHGMEKEENAGQLSLQVIGREMEPGQDNLFIHISAYQPDDLPEEVAITESFSRIDFWEVDLDYREGVFYSDIQVIRPRRNCLDDSLPLSVSLTVPHKEGRQVAVRVHDIWGKKCTGVVGLETKR